MKPTFEQIRNAKQILSDAGYIGVWQLFSDQDVNHRCSELGFEKPNDDEMVEIIGTIETEFDSNTGINWNAIDNGIIDVMKKD